MNPGLWNHLSGLFLGIMIVEKKKSEKKILISCWKVFCMYCVCQFSGARGFSRAAYGMGCAQSTSDPRKLTDSVYVTHLSSLNVEREGSKCTKTGDRGAFTLNSMLSFQCCFTNLWSSLCGSSRLGLICDDFSADAAPTHSFCLLCLANRFCINVVWSRLIKLIIRLICISWK